MKTYYQEVTFTCDECKTEAKFEVLPEQENPFPYGEGWVYMHEFNIKMMNNNEGIEVAKDKHFCCDECLVAWLTKHIKKTRYERGHQVKDGRK